MNRKSLSFNKNELESNENIQQDLLPIQVKLWSLLEKRTKLYTMGDSTSIPKEIAEELLNSICFTLGINTENSVETLYQLKNVNLEEKYNQGLKVIEKKIEAGKHLWERTCFNTPKIDNISMNSTLKSIGIFWKRHDYNFFAHDIPCDIDYQLCHAVPTTFLGIDYINQWLLNITIENEFLLRFHSDLCIKLLESYCKDYKGLLINLYEPIATNALGLALIGGNISKLNITEVDRKKIAAIFKYISPQQSIELLKDATETLLQFLNIINKSSKDYLEKLAIDLYPRIQVSIDNAHLEGVFLSIEN